MEKIMFFMFEKFNKRKKLKNGGKNSRIGKKYTISGRNSTKGKKFKDREKSNAIEIKTVKVFGKNFFSQIFILKI